MELRRRSRSECAEVNIALDPDVDTWLNIFDRSSDGRVSSRMTKKSLVSNFVESVKFDTSDEIIRSLLFTFIDYDLLIRLAVITRKRISFLNQ